MTATCPVCHQPQRDGVMCRKCGDRLLTDLSALPGLMRDLDDVLTRQTQTGTGNGRRPSAAEPLPYDQSASVVRWEVVNTITSWIRELDLGDGESPAPTFRGMCGWLAHRIKRIGMHPAAAEIHDELTYAIGSVRRKVDTPQPRVLHGQCDICGRPLYGADDATEITCPLCEWSGVTSVLLVDPSSRPRWRDAPDALVTRSVALDACSYHGTPVKPETFRTWVKRTRLARHDDPADRGRNLYRLGDVLELASERVKAG